MHHRLVMVTARGLIRNGTMVAVDAETARVCDAAVKRLRSLPERASIIVTAGHAEKFDVIMGAGPMLAHLAAICGVQLSRIYSPVATEFNTNGEMKALVGFMWERLLSEPQDTFEVHLAASWWHLPRARALLHARLEPWLRKQTKVHWVPAPSHPPWDWRLWYFIAREVAAWVRNIRNGNVFWWRHRLYYCYACATFNCVDAAREDYDLCHRCGHKSSRTHQA